MSFQSMAAEVHGCVPKIPYDYCKTLVNRAWRDVRRKNLWSFQLFDTNWVTSNLIGNISNSSPLSCNVTQGNNQVVFNAAANTAIAAIGPGPFPMPITALQFRVGVSTIYNIWAYNNTSATATLDRPYTDTTANNSNFVIGSYYMTVPYSDFVRFLNVVDMLDFQVLDLSKNREWVAKQDPQLAQYFWPTHAVPYERELNSANNNYGYFRYLLWGLPQTSRTYQLLGIREGSDLINNGDTLPFCIGEDVVLSLAKCYAYEYAESSKGDNPRDQGPDWRFLIGTEQKNYDRLFREYRQRDRETVDNWFTVVRPGGFTYNAPFYTSIGSIAWPGLPW